MSVFYGEAQMKVWKCTVGWTHTVLNETQMCWWVCFPHGWVCVWPLACRGTGLRVCVCVCEERVPPRWAVPNEARSVSVGQTGLVFLRNQESWGGGETAKWVYDCCCCCWCFSITTHTTTAANAKPLSSSFLVSKYFLKSKNTEKKYHI